MSRQLLQLLLIIFAAIQLGCVKNNPAPSWIEINEWQLQSNPGASQNLGDLSLSAFTEAWIYVNDELLGVFELPVKVPILKVGEVNIKIYPAIKNNGISATKKIYPFTEFYEADINLVQNETLQIDPVTQYYSTVKAYIENFEDTTSDIENSPVTDNSIMIGSDNTIGYSGQYGWIHLDADKPSWLGFTTSSLNLPRGQEVYLEVDYRNTNSLLTGVVSISSEGTKSNPYILLNKQEAGSDKWKKIYIDLREIIGNSPADAYFEIFFECQKEAELTASDVYIDNVRVVYF